MKTTTEFCSDFYRLLDDSAPSFRYILETVAGDFRDDYDLDSAEYDLVDECNKVARRFGIQVTASGCAYMEADNEVNTGSLALALAEIDLGDILDRNDEAEAEGRR